MRILVTGGNGFLGGAVVRLALARGWQVTTLHRRDHPGLRLQGVTVVTGDAADQAAVDRAMRGCEAVVHVAGKAGVWGPEAAYRRANVQATACVLDACRRHGVDRLVYTSTPSVVHAGHDLTGIDETAPYPARYDTHYAATKAEAEREVLRANDPRLATVALRPHLLWGPGDTQLAPRIVDRARRGRLRLVGDGTNLVDATYIDNAAQAHLDALDRLTPGAPCAGRAYFIAQGEPVPVRRMIDGILAAHGLPPVQGSVSPGLAVAVGAVLEALWWLAGREDEPPMTRFAARQLATSHWYDLGAARRDLGYHPHVGLEEGFRRLTAHVAGV